MLLFNRFATVALTVVSFYVASTSLVFAVSSKDQEPVSLTELVNLGLSVSPRVNSASAELSSAETNIEVEKGGYWPSLSMSVGPAHGVFGELGYDVALTQVLYDWGEIDSKVDVATSKKRQKSYSLLMARSEVALEIVEVYFDIVSAQQKLALIDDYDARLQKIFTFADKRARGNFSDHAELSRVKQAMSYAHQQKALLTGDLKGAQSRYLNLLRSQPINLPPLPKVSDLFTQKLTDDASIRELIEGSPQYIKQREELTIAEINVQKSQASQRPKLVAQAQAQRRDIGGELTDDSSVAVRFQMSIDNGLSSFKRIDAQRIDVQASKWELESVALKMERDIVSNRESMAALRSQEALITDQLVETEVLIKTYRAQFDAGIRTIEELLTSQRENYELLTQLETNRFESYRLPYRSASELGILPQLLIEQDSRPVN